MALKELAQRAGAHPAKDHHERRLCAEGAYAARFDGKSSPAASLADGGLADCAGGVGGSATRPQPDLPFG